MLHTYVCNCTRHGTTQVRAAATEIACVLNRAACRLKLGRNEAAADDCSSVLETEPNNTKALFRRGQALVRWDGGALD